MGRAQTITELSMPLAIEEWQRCYIHAAERKLDRHEVSLATKQLIDAASAGAAQRIDKAHEQALPGR